MKKLTVLLCAFLSTVIVTTAQSLSVSATTTANEICYYGNIGSISSSVSGGRNPYAYSWSGGQTTSTVSSLNAGTFTVTVTDGLGATASASATVTQPTAISISGSATANVSCYGGSNGIALASPSGGTSPYSYYWYPSGGTNSTLTGLTAGTYSVFVTDNNGCGSPMPGTATITQPTVLSVSATTTANVNCYGGSTGSVSSTPMGGTSPYTYSWSGGGTNSTKTGLIAGTYTISLSDKNGCTATASTTITQAGSLTFTATAKHSSVCPGTSDSLFCTGSGGTNPYTYAWIAPIGDLSNTTSQNVNSYPYGSTYFVSAITDTYGCTSSASVNVTINPFPYVSIAGPMNPIAPGRSDTLIANIVGSGTYLWSNSATTSSIIVSPSVSTTYFITTSNIYGCYDTAHYTIDTNSIGNGTSSSSPIRIVPSSYVNPVSFSTKDSVEWFSFVPTDSNNQIIAYSNYLGMPVPHVHRLTLFNSSLHTIVDEPMPDITGANQIRIDASHLDIGSTYLVRVARTSAHTNMPGCNPTGDVCNASQRWDFQMAFRTVPVFVPNDSGAEAPGINQLYYECRGQIDDMNKIPRFDIKAYTNFTSPALYASDSALSFVYLRTHNYPSILDTVQRVDMEFTGAYVQPSQPVFKMQQDSDAGYLNYFLGFVQNGVPKVEGYSRLVYKNIYANVDMHVFSNAAGTKFYFVCNPGGTGGGGNPANIELKFKGANSVSVTGGGLQVVTDLGTLSFAPGYAYTDSAGIVKPKSWQAYFVSVNSTTVKFNTGTYNTNEPLIIQVDRGHVTPSGGSCLENLCWSTCMGGNNGADEINGLYTDTKGNVYAAGETNSTTFPATNGVVQDTSLVQVYPFLGNATIAKFDLNTKLLWATYYGGSYLTDANSIVADATQNVFITGLTYSFYDFPRQQPNVVQYPNAYYQLYCNGDPTLTCTDGDAFVVELNQAGSQKKWATWWGGCDGIQGGQGVYSEVGNRLVIDNNKHLYVVGGHSYEIVYGKDPLVNEGGAYNDTVGTGFILKFNIDSSSVNFAQLEWATNIGGNNGSSYTQDGLAGCAVDANNNLFVIGATDFGYGNIYPVGYSGTPVGTYEGNNDAVITKFDATSNNIDWAEFYGGDFDDYGQAITISPSGNVYITGYTDSPGSTGKIPLHDPNPGHDFIQTNNNDGPAGSGGMNGFVAELNNTTGGIYWSTYFGGTYNMYVYGIALDADSDIYITGTTENSFPSPSAPIANTYTLSFTGHPNNPFLAEFNSQLQYGWGTCLDGTGTNLGYDAAFAAATDNIHNLLYIAGKTASTGNTFPNIQYDGGFIQPTNNESPDVTSFISRFNLAPIITGVDNLSEKSGGINVYPNPFTGSITVEMNLTQKESVEFILYNVMGQMVYEKNISEQGGLINQQIDLSLLSEGIYLLKVNEGNTYFTKKIIKQD